MKSQNYHRKKAERELRMAVDHAVQSAIDSRKPVEQLRFDRAASIILPLWMARETKFVK